MKKWYQSKTIIFNSIGGFIFVLPEILSLIDINVLKALGVSDPARYYSLIVVLISALNIYLRAKSPKPSAPIQTAARVEKSQENTV